MPKILRSCAIKVPLYFQSLAYDTLTSYKLAIYWYTRCRDTKTANLRRANMA